MKNQQEAVEKCWIWNSVTLTHSLLAHSRVATIHECKLNFMLGQVTFATVLSKRFMILYNLYRYIDVSLCTFGSLISIIKRDEISK